MAYENRRQVILDAVVEAVEYFLYEGRRADEELSSSAIEDAIGTDEITIEEIVEEFECNLRERLFHLF